jgi:hypothetical protein
MTEPDEIDDLLSPRDSAPAVHSREAIFRRTERALARRRLLRQTAKAAAVTAVFVAGGLGGWFAKPEQVRTIEIAVVSPVEVIVPVPVPVPAADRIKPPPSEPATPGQAELLAEQADDPAEAARLYRLAGDRYLNDFQDYRNASRCYRLHLMRAGDSGLTPQRDDTWLLTSLKNEAFREKFHVAKTDG